MNPTRFDALVRLLGGAASRRRLLGLVAALGAGFGAADVAAACDKPCGPCRRCRRGECVPKRAGTPCGTRKACRKGRCRPAPDGDPCPGGTCRGGACEPDCLPDCAGKECGPDGCGGFCGTCAVGLCDEGACVCRPLGAPCSPGGANLCCTGTCGTPGFTCVCPGGQVEENGACREANPGELPVSARCNPANPAQCASGICGCNGEDLCTCRLSPCAGPGEPCVGLGGNARCCERVCLGTTGNCFV